MSQLKSGNVVRFKDPSSSGHSGSVHNRLYTVRREVFGDLVDLVDNEGKLIAVSNYRVELVAEGKLPFTSGDKVVITNSNWRYDGYKAMAAHLELTNWASIYDAPQDRAAPQNGDVATVITASLHENGRTVVYAVQTENGKQHIMGAEGLEKYVEPVAPTFKVGDRVKLKGDVQRPHYGTGGYNRGDVGTVRSVVPEGSYGFGDMCVDFPQHSCWAARVSEMELAINTPLEDAQEEIERLKKVLDLKDKELVEIRAKVSQATEMLDEI